MTHETPRPANLTADEHQALDGYATSLSTIEGLAQADLGGIKTAADSDRFRARFLGMKGELAAASFKLSKLPLRGEGYTYAGQRLEALRRSIGGQWEARRVAVGGKA